LIVDVTKTNGSYQKPVEQHLKMNFDL
jgi:hypothetical protein